MSGATAVVLLPLGWVALGPRGPLVLIEHVVAFLEGDADDGGDGDGDEPRGALTDAERAACVRQARFTERADCPVCLEPHEARASALRCGHAFHADCIGRWLERARTCPMCRADVTGAEPR
jgi:hypothetical protein